MTATQIERLIKVLRTNGVTHFKSDDLEINFASTEFKSPEKIPAKTKPKSSEPEDVITLVPQKQASATPPPAPAQKKSKAANSGDVAIKNMNIPHHVNNMVSVLQMSDEDLIEQIFPIKPLEQSPEQASN